MRRCRFYLEGEKGEKREKGEKTINKAKTNINIYCDVE